MNVIYKYSIEVGQPSTLELPLNAKILKVTGQDGEIMMWVSQTVETELTGTWDEETRSFLVYANGEPYNPVGKTHVGTALVGEYVWHVFEVGDNTNE